MQLAITFLKRTLAKPNQIVTYPNKQKIVQIVRIVEYLLIFQTVLH